MGYIGGYTVGLGGEYGMGNKGGYRSLDYGSHTPKSVAWYYTDVMQFRSHSEYIILLHRPEP